MTDRNLKKEKKMASHQRGQLAHIVSDGCHQFSRAQTQTHKQTQEETRCFQGLKEQMWKEPETCFWVVQQDPGASAVSRDIKLGFNLSMLFGSTPAGSLFIPRVSQKHVLV